MNADTLLPTDTAFPWSRLKEAGWFICHMRHARLAGEITLEVIIQKNGKVIREQAPECTVFTKLEVAAGIESRKALPKKETVKADPRHTEFISAWQFAYTQHFQRPYTFNGPIDGKALKTFLAANDGKVSTMVQTARSAWDRQDQDPFCKACKQSVSIRGFCQQFNEIAAELTRNTRQGNGSTFQL